MISPSLPRRVLLTVALALVTVSTAWSQATEKTQSQATFKVRVYPDAVVTVDDAETKQQGASRSFYSPPLEPGKTYYYTFVAKWMPNTYETFTVKRKVTFKAGENVEVDLRKMDAKKGDNLEIIYVPTPQEIVDAMMKLARVGKDDVVYDLGCGDGRIVITAVKKYNAKRGVGVDLDPKQIKDAKDNALRAGVEKKVEFRQDNVFNVKDLSDATVVTLYMSDELNEQLMPRLKAQLKPGARIVSHRFKMGNWTPDKTEKVDIEHDQDEEKYIHLWTIKKGDKPEK